MSAPNEEFRDSIGTITGDGKRRWIYPKMPKGLLYNLRSYVSYVYLLVFFTLPWLKWRGEPLFLFNIFERKFIFFGKIFWPQDFFLFVIGFLTFLVFIVLFTVVFGRLFCGWVCPQTIFMEMVFRKIEYLIEGDGEKQKRLTQQSWNGEKLLKRGGKLVVFFLVSLLIGHYFLAYLIGMDKVVMYIREGIGEHVLTFIPLMIFSATFFSVYAFFREQACLIVCPYGRLQGVMLDSNSIVVAYDRVRGEPRGHFRKNEERTKGDCIDCNDCVKVCPTGIDIRNGTQLECVNCTACIDACNAIMHKMNFEPGLIRYASENNIVQKEKVRFTPRIAGYTFVLTLLIGVLAVLLVTRKDIQTTVMRAQGLLFQEQPNEQVSNLYNIKLVNKTRNSIPVKLMLEDDLKGRIQMVGKDLVVKPESVGDGEFFVYLDKSELHGRKTKIEIAVFANGVEIDEVKTTFLGPNN